MHQRDRQTDGQTDGHWATAKTARTHISSRGNNTYRNTVQHGVYYLITFGSVDASHSVYFRVVGKSVADTARLAHRLRSLVVGCVGGFQTTWGVVTARSQRAVQSAASADGLIMPSRHSFVTGWRRICRHLPDRSVTRATSRRQIFSVTLQRFLTYVNKNFKRRV